MAKKHKGGSKWLNPPFDPRILKIGRPEDNAAKLKRGYVVLDSNGAPNMAGKGVQFLYNPVSVSASHTIDPNNVIDSSKQQAATNTGQAGQIVNIGSTSVDLLYDRTYELWDSSKKHTMAGQMGVYSDVLAWYQLLGVVRSAHVETLAPEVSSFNGFDQFPSYPISYTGRYYLYIGDKIRYYGILSDFSVTYSHFTQNMIPSRASVSLSLMFMVDNKGGVVDKHGGVHSKSGTGINKHPNPLGGLIYGSGGKKR